MSPRLSAKPAQGFGIRTTVREPAGGYAPSFTYSPDTSVAGTGVPMDPFSRGFVQASLLWLVLGVTLGVAMAVHPMWTVYRPMHLHLTLLGFVTMMIYGVAYHVLPRFTGRPLWSRRLPVWHLWLSNLGLALMCVGFALRPSISADQSVATLILGSGGTLSALGAYLFAFNAWRTISASPAPAPVTTIPIRTNVKI
ncbi:MAG: cbb3-type cytochrome c oxidase subunit I [Gemmatimonadaceae bacterium]